MSFLCCYLTTICHPSFLLSLHQIIVTTSCLRNKRLRMNVSVFLLCPALCSIPVPSPINLQNGLREKHIAAISPVCLSLDQLLASDKNSLLWVLCSFHKKPSACGKYVIKEKWQESESDGMVKKKPSRAHLQCYCLEWLCPNDNHILPSMA